MWLFTPEGTFAVIPAISAFIGILVVCRRCRLMRVNEGDHEGDREWVWVPQPRTVLLGTCIGLVVGLALVCFIQLTLAFVGVGAVLISLLAAVCVDYASTHNIDGSPLSPPLTSSERVLGAIISVVMSAFIVTFLVVASRPGFTAGLIAIALMVLADCQRRRRRSSGIQGQMGEEV